MRTRPQPDERRGGDRMRNVATNRMRNVAANG
jgi:hypothetical protein